MILTHLNIKNLRLINFPSSRPLSNRTGSFFLNTISGSMASLSSQFSAVMVNPFLKILSAPFVVLLTITFMTIMVEMVSTSAKSAVRPSVPTKLLQHLSDLPVLIVATHSLPRKTENSSAYINVSIPNVLTISTTKKVEQKDLDEDYGKNKYKLHYIYRKFTVDFFAMDLNSLLQNDSSLKFSKHNAHFMSLCLTLHINLGLSLRKTSQALKDPYNICC